jgi:hypothetical protein
VPVLALLRWNEELVVLRVERVKEDTEDVALEIVVVDDVTA